jgi:eukaryotic-like serine/threonine-protein kinase
MNPRSRRNPSLAPGLAARLDAACDRFEAQWLAGTKPRVEDFLADVDEADRPALLAELLALDGHYRGGPTLSTTNTPSGAAQAVDLVAGEQAGCYQMGEEIARGGMGAVFRATDTSLDRDVAVKVLLAAASDRPELAQRFGEEARITGRLQHPGVGYPCAPRHLA